MDLGQHDCRSRVAFKIGIGVSLSVQVKLRPEAHLIQINAALGNRDALTVDKESEGNYARIKGDWFGCCPRGPGVGVRLVGAQRP